MMQVPKKYLIWSVVVVLLGGFVLDTLQRQILFPTGAIPVPPSGLARPPGLIRVDLSIPKGIVEGWFVPGRGVTAEKPGPVVFFGHGNGELIDYAAPGLEPYLRRGVSLALLEYRGYGRSSGTPSQEAIVGDMVQFYDTISARPEVDPTRIIFHGRSLGGGVVCGLAAERTPQALILESTFRSVAVMARQFLLPRFFVRDPFDNEAVLADLDLPVLLFHGTRDELIPYAHGEALAAVARDARLVSFECGHNDLPPQLEPYWTEIDTYLRSRGTLP